MKTGSINKFEHLWVYNVFNESGGINPQISRSGDSPMPNKPGLYLIDDYGSPAIFIIFEINDTSVLARTVHIHCEQLEILRYYENIKNQRQPRL